MSGTAMPPGQVRARVGVLVLGAGVAMVALACMGYSADHRPGQSAAPPRPTVTRTVMPSTVPPASRPGDTKPKPRHAADGVRIVAASAPKTHSGGGTTPRRPSAIAPSGPKPRPPAAPPTSTRSCDIGLSALVLNACLNLGAR